MEWLVSLPERLDTFLAAEGRMLSRVKAKKAIEEGKVMINDVVTTKVAERLQEGDVVKIMNSEMASESQNDDIVPTNMDLAILYEDDACFVINKPAGIAVHPGAGMQQGEKTLLEGIAFLFAERSLPFSPASVLVHRLDRETTGCILVAKNEAAHLFLQKQFESRTTKKIYLALVAGVPSPAEAHIDAPVGRSTSNRTKMGVMGITAGRSAQTTYRTLETKGNVALLACNIHTGRTHQIRVHLTSIGHPVLGDSTYVNTLSERLADEYDIQSLCLHAWSLTFVSPANKKEQTVTAKLPDSFIRIVERIGLTEPTVPR